MIVEQSKEIIEQVSQAFIGKSDIVEKSTDDYLCRRTHFAGGLSGSGKDDSGAGIFKSTRTQ